MQELEKILEEIEIKAIKDLEEENDRCSTTCEGCCSDVKERKCNCRDAIIIRAFKKLAKCMNDGWIPVERGLPEEAGIYIVNALNGERSIVTFAKWKNRYKRFDMTGARAYWRVIAWRPLPEPYRPERRIKNDDVLR